MEVTTQVSDVPPFASAKEALGMLRSAMGYLSAADATAMAAQTQAQCLQALEQVTAMGTAARASILAAFTAGQGYSADADYSAKAWLINRTRITKGAAVAHTAWARRAAAHPKIAEALAAGKMSESVARTICQWTDKLPEDCRDAADEILIAAAKAGMDLRDLAELAGEIYQRSQPDDAGGPDDGFEDRSVKLETTFQGAGVLTGDLTPECAAVVTAVLDALSAPAGAEDTRTHAQRYHDGLAEAMRRLVAAGLLPERAGQPVKVWAHVSLADLLVLDGSSALLEEWIGSARAAWAAHRAAGPQDGTGAVPEGGAADTGAAGPQAGSGAAPGPDTARAWQALEQAIIGKAVDLLSGPGGLASFLRRRQLGARLGGPSLPLDVGFSQNVPAAIRNAVILRDKHCRWAGRCNQPAAACQVHHVTHKANGGKTSLKDCVLLCWYHHEVVIHRWGWTLVLNPDGTTTAWNPAKTKVLHSHSPPTRPG